MEKRRSKRKPVDLLKVDVIADGIKSTGVIENITKYGMHLITASKNSEATLVPETILELQFKSSEVTIKNLFCEIRWVHINKTPIHGLTYRMGMEVVKYPADFNEILTTLE